MRKKKENEIILGEKTIMMILHQVPQQDLNIFCNDAIFKIEDSVVLPFENKFY